ncbi:hypothetical protein GCM10025781_28290 [Kocuria gwangalliensis]|uniref:Uncharacterized protein n=1 Tax=Kocuria gwangalliensis TaxID=501592 RepID=A0ABP8XK78_9MICC
MSAAIRTITNDTELRAAKTRAIIPSMERVPTRAGRAGRGRSWCVGSDMITKVSMSRARWMNSEFDKAGERIDSRVLRRP